MEKRRHVVALSRWAESDPGREERLRIGWAELKLVARALRHAMEAKRLRAPIAGVLEDLRAYPGQWVTNREPLGLVSERNRLVFRALVVSSRASLLNVGQVASIRLDVDLPGAPGAISGRIIEDARMGNGSLLPSHERLDGKMKKLLGKQGPAQQASWITLALEVTPETLPGLRPGLLGWLEVSVH